MIGIIAGTGLEEIEGLQGRRELPILTPYGSPSAPICAGELAGVPVAFLARHGRGHTLPPHRINYRANLFALREAGVGRVVAVAAVGGITAAMRPGRLVFPSQLIDYTWGRDHTYADGGNGPVLHVDFTDPYCERTRRVLIDAAITAGVDAAIDGVYGATQGPRLESAAEIARMERDGCDIVGMTGMPETALARELGIGYACCAVVANWAAGRGAGPITMEAMTAALGGGMADVTRLLSRALPSLHALS
ncbi:MAG: S-methyl-5'-thioinosine phosphorylase [Gammaproteobacteria bacterium]